MKLLHFFVNTAVLLALGNPVLAQNAPACQSLGLNYMMFGNGVFNDFDGAHDSAMELAVRVQERIAGTYLENNLIYGVTYNPTSVATYGLLDLLETFQQNAQTDFSQFWRILSGLELMPDFILERIPETAKAIDALILQVNPVIQMHVNTYNKLLSEGSRVLVVAHSQGNLFANIAYLGIKQDYKSGFRIVSVATPDSFTAGDGPYTTIGEDLIIRAVPFSRPVSFKNFDSVNLGDRSGHQFVKSYLSPGRKAESKILDDVVSSLNVLVAPTIELPSDAAYIVINTTLGSSCDEPDASILTYNGVNLSRNSADIYTAWIDYETLEDGVSCRTFNLRCASLHRTVSEIPDPNFVPPCPITIPTIRIPVLTETFECRGGFYQRDHGGALFAAEEYIYVGPGSGYHVSDQ